MQSHVVERELPSIIIAVGILGLIVAVIIAVGSATLAVTTGGALLGGFVFGGVALWRPLHHGYYLWVGAGLIVFGLLFMFTFLYGELWALIGVFVFGLGMGVFTRRWLVAQGG